MLLHKGIFSFIVFIMFGTFKITKIYHVFVFPCSRLNKGFTVKVSTGSVLNS